MTAISPELVERMVKLVRDMVRPKAILNWIDTAEKIAALLPAPVDPDIVLAREIADRVTDCGYDYHAGLKDAYPIVAGILAGIKRGRELANDGWIVWRGGKCPLRPGEKAEAMMRDGQIIPHEQIARWSNLALCAGPGWMRDIIAYRIVKRAEGGV